MKKTILFSLMMAATVAGYAQGVVAFQNNVTFLTSASTGSPNGHTDRLVYGTDNTTLLKGTNWVANLFYAVGSGQTESALAFDTADSSRIDSTNRSFFAAGNDGKWFPQNKTFVNVDKGGSVTAQVRVWDGSLFGTFGAAIAAGGITGRSAVFNYTVPNSAQPLTTDFYMEGLRSFTLQVPEPSTIALGVLGAASLLVVRRRKQ